MVWFFLIAVLMVVACIAMLVGPMVRQRSRQSADLVNERERQNVVIAREHLAQLETQLEAGTIDPERAAQQKSEIELALLHDVETQTAAGDDQVVGPRNGGGAWAGVVVAAIVPVLAGLVYLTLGQPAALVPGADSSLGSSGTEGHTDVDIDAMVRRLEQKLAASPDDTQGWYMLATSYMTLRQFVKAAQAFETLRGLVGDDPELLVREADALAMANDGVLEGAPVNLLLRALAVNPDHPVALWLMGISEQTKGNTSQALHYWEQAEPLFSESPESQHELRTMIEQARNELSLGTKSDFEPSESGQSDDAAVTAGSAAKSIAVTVTLDEAFSGQVAPGDTVFVLARAHNGPAMPLAVVRMHVRDLPASVTLDDTMAMVPAMTLSSQEQVTVVAKVSKSGDAITQSGDLIGETGPISIDQTAPVVVSISKVAP